MRWILFVLMIVIFAYSVTLKYHPSEPVFYSGARTKQIIERRPAYPLVQYMNMYQSNAKVFINHLDEYRAWFDCETVGRREWRNSWNDYITRYPDNTASDLNEYLTNLGCTHIMVMPYGPFILPIEDEEYDDFFAIEAYYENYVAWAVLELAEKPREFDGIGGIGDPAISSRPDTSLQE